MSHRRQSGHLESSVRILLVPGRQEAARVDDLIVALARVAARQDFAAAQQAVRQSAGSTNNTAISGTTAGAGNDAGR